MGNNGDKDKDSTELMLSGFLNNLEGVLERQNRSVLEKVGQVSREVDSIRTDLDSVKREVTFIKDEQPLTRREAGHIKRAVARRVCELLDVPKNKKDRNIEQKIKYEKYSRKLFGVCYSEVSREGHMAKSSYLDTARKDYDATLKDIDAFSPSSGMNNFYRLCDEEALARKIAKEQGYE